MSTSFDRAVLNERFPVGPDGQGGMKMKRLREMNGHEIAAALNVIDVAVAELNKAAAPLVPKAEAMANGEMPVDLGLLNRLVKLKKTAMEREQQGLRLLETVRGLCPEAYEDKPFFRHMDEWWPCAVANG